MKNKKSQRGFIMLIELLMSIAVFGVLAAMATVSLVQVMAAQNQRHAELHIRQVANAIAAQQTCVATPGCSVPVGLTSQVPALGSSIVQEAYRFNMTDLGGGFWAYTAEPLSPYAGHFSFYVDNTGVIRCQQSVTITAGAGACAF